MTSGPFTIHEGDTVYLTRDGVREPALRVTNVEQDDEPLTTPGIVVRTTTVTCEFTEPED